MEQGMSCWEALYLYPSLLRSYECWDQRYYSCVWQLLGDKGWIDLDVYRTGLVRMQVHVVVDFQSLKAA